MNMRASGGLPQSSHERLRYSAFMERAASTSRSRHPCEPFVKLRSATDTDAFQSELYAFMQVQKTSSAASATLSSAWHAIVRDGHCRSRAESSLKERTV